ncbi:uncharacterized protein [Malus domestica]|uniref:uncharacterized protein n=1 Tax=Malus domestica TaxID=3750 RepID=UPI003975AB52
MDFARTTQGYKGNKFTWETTHGGGIRVRFDRVLVNQEWINLFPNASVFHPKPNSSDHIPLLLDWEAKCILKYKKSFHYEEAWMTREGCTEAVKLGWTTKFEGSPMFQVAEKIKATRIQLINWVNRGHRRLPGDIAAIEDKLNSLFGQSFNDTTIAQRKELYMQLHSLLAQEEAFWMQRSRENWLHLGDQNTKYFHQKVNRRQQRNGLHGLFDENGDWHDNKPGIENIIMNYFTKIFYSPGTTEFDEVLEAVTPIVGPDLNAALTMPFTDEEIKMAFFQMHPSKSPGPDACHRVRMHVTGFLPKTLGYGGTRRMQ